MAALVALPQDLPSREPSPPPTLTLNTALHGSSGPVPNKHLPFCSPGPNPTFGLPSPPASPPSPSSASVGSQHLLFPPDPHSRIFDEPPVYAITAATLAEALDQAACQPLPDPAQVFPWLHGLHEDNHIQLAFFGARRKILRRAPRCLRGLTVVKAGSDLEHSRIKGAVAPEELLPPLGSVALAPCFHDPNPRAGFSVRNFQIQTCKLATVSDIVVYGDDSTPREQVHELARTIAQAQVTQRQENDNGVTRPEEYSTFVLTDSFAALEQKHPDAVALDSTGSVTGNVMSFSAQERVEMCALSKASEVAPNVWLGPTPSEAPGLAQPGEPHFDVMIEASDLATIPVARNLDEVEAFLNENEVDQAIAHLEFPSSGSFAAVENGVQNNADVNRIIQLFRWMHKITTPQQPEQDQDGDVAMTASSPPRRVLIHCQDGYTETSLIAVAYCMFAAGLPAHQAWIHMHKDLQRNFFAYPTDKYYLENIQLRVLQESPALAHGFVPPPRPSWMQKMDGSLPSRILPYLYLGNLNHAQNPEMLELLGITRVLSVGEPITWSEAETTAWGADRLLMVDKVQDNGVDPLAAEIDKCLAFIGEAKQRGEAVLVHCRVGVSRSATICIAEVMKEMGLSFPRAYCFVRARRLNVIIQPHLRFTYELIKYEEAQQAQRGLPLRRELEWATITREIALMNKPYCRQ